MERAKQGMNLAGPSALEILRMTKENSVYSVLCGAYLKKFEIRNPQLEINSRLCGEAL
jgi:hypothetical protein